MDYEVLRRIFFRRLRGDEIKHGMIWALKRVQEEVPEHSQSYSHSIITNMTIKEHRRDLEHQLFATYCVSAMSALQSGDKETAKQELANARSIRRTAVKRDGDFNPLSSKEIAKLLRTLSKETK